MAMQAYQHVAFLLEIETMTEADRRQADARSAAIVCVLSGRARDAARRSRAALAGWSAALAHGVSAIVQLDAGPGGRRL
jgi:hypothetical protein